MRISTQVPYARGFRDSTDQIVALEAAGLDLVWIPEVYGFDAPSFMGYLAARTTKLEIGSAILPVFTRTPSLIAMTAAGIDDLSEGRAVLGLGASGPQVIEGFHGVPYERPLARTRDVVSICRKIWARDEALTHEGVSHAVPLPSGSGTGLGKPLKIITHPCRSSVPIYVAALGEKSVEQTAEIADGWLPTLFVPEKAKDVFGSALAAGRTRRDPMLNPLEVCAGGLTAICEEGEAPGLRDLARPQVALYVGGMGARGRNFYNDLIRRYGWEREAEAIQSLYLEGAKRDAAAAVPAELLEATTLIGPEGYIKERIAAFKEAGVTTLDVLPVGPDAASVIERLKTWSE